MSGQKQLHGDVVADTDVRIAVLEEELEGLRNELRAAKAAGRVEKEDTARALSALRTQLTPLYRALQMVFGEMDVIDGGGSAPAQVTASGGMDPRVSAVWASWKQRLPPKCGDAIDALMIHGALNVKQWCVASKMGQNTLYGVIAKLKTAGLIDVNGGRYSLKAL